MTFPNILTLIRIGLMPIFVLSFCLPFAWTAELCAGLFALAAITDFVDGYLARKWQQTSAFGKFFDPVADKLIVAVALLVLVGQQATLWLTLPAIVILCREILVSALREWMAEVGKS